MSEHRSRRCHTRSDAGTPCLSASALICSAAPCTSTTRMLKERNTATSRRMLAKFSSVTMPASTAMMNVFSRNCGTYWRIPRRSDSFTLAPARLFRGLLAASKLETFLLYNEAHLSQPGLFWRCMDQGVRSPAFRALALFGQRTPSCPKERRRAPLPLTPNSSREPIVSPRTCGFGCLAYCFRMVLLQVVKTLAKMYDSAVVEFFLWALLWQQQAPRSDSWPRKSEGNLRLLNCPRLIFSANSMPLLSPCTDLRAARHLAGSPTAFL